MLVASTPMVPTPVCVWRDSSATDAPANPGEPRSPRLSCTSTTNSAKGPDSCHLHLSSTSCKLHGSNKKGHATLRNDLISKNNNINNKKTHTHNCKNRREHFEPTCLFLLRIFSSAGNFFCIFFFFLKIFTAPSAACLVSSRQTLHLTSALQKDCNVYTLIVCLSPNNQQEALVP